MNVPMYPPKEDNFDSLCHIIPLLSPKHLNSFSPEEYKAYVRSLYDKPEKRRLGIRLKKKKPEFAWKKTPAGNISITINRRPKWLSREEIEQIVKESALPANEVWLHVLNPKKMIRVSTREEEERIMKSIEEIPWPSLEEKKK